MFYHIIRVVIHAFAISYSIIMHIGSTEEITLLEFNEEEEGLGWLEDGWNPHPSG